MVQVFSARFQDGTIVPDEGIELPEGARVTVIVDSTAATFELSTEDEAEILEAIAEVERGNVISADELFRRLGR